MRISFEGEGKQDQFGSQGLLSQSAVQGTLQGQTYSLRGPLGPAYSPVLRFGYATRFASLPRDVSLEKSVVGGARVFTLVIFLCLGAFAFDHP